MSSIKRDDNKQKWEDTEFPLVCETCLGDNPYIRMTKEPFGKQCQVCERRLQSLLGKQVQRDV